MKLLSTTVKTAKTEKAFPDWENTITYLMPNKVLCPFSDNCLGPCLKSSGRLPMSKKLMIERANKRILNESQLPRTNYSDFDVLDLLSVIYPKIGEMPKEVWDKMGEICKKKLPREIQKWWWWSTRWCNDVKVFTNY